MVSTVGRELATAAAAVVVVLAAARLMDHAVLRDRGRKRRIGGVRGWETRGERGDCGRFLCNFRC